MPADRARLSGGFAGRRFDRHGVLTRSAKLRAASWKAMFDPYLRSRAAAANADSVPFDPQGVPSDPPHRRNDRGLQNGRNASTSSSASTASARPTALRADGPNVVVGDRSELL